MLYYYSRLSAAMQKAYDVLLDGIRCMSPSITVRGVIDPQEIPIVISAVNRDNPDLFWWNSSQYSYSVRPINPRIHFHYINLPTDEIKERCDKLVEWKTLVTEAVIHKSKQYSLTTTDKVWLIGDHLASRMAYSDNSDILFIDRHSIWGAYSGAGVCEAISKAFQYIVSDNPALHLKGIYIEGCLHECRSKTDPKTPNHAWNAIVDDGFIYHLDLTAQIQRAHIPFIGASKAVFLTPEQMQNHYSLCVGTSSPLYVPETCHRLT